MSDSWLDDITQQMGEYPDVQFPRTEMTTPDPGSHKVDIPPIVNGQKQAEPVARWFSDIEPREIGWLWPNRIALGKLTLLVGDPGTGKSTATCDFAARVSTGEAWPDGSPCPVGSTLILNCEDSPEDTIHRRLVMHDADLTKVRNFDGVRGADGKVRPFTLNDVDMLDVLIETMPGCKLVIVDPISAYLGKVDSHKNGEVRGVLAGLSAVAEKHGTAVLGITHLTKAGPGRSQAMYRAMGSLGFIAAARAAWAFVHDPDDPDRSLVLEIKNNLAPRQDGLAYRIVANRLIWIEGAVSGSVDDIMNARSEGDDPEAPSLAAAAEFLRTELKEGEVRAKEIERRAKDAGHRWATIKRAADGVGVRPRKYGFGEDGYWVWEIPTPP